MRATLKTISAVLYGPWVLFGGRSSCFSLIVTHSDRRIAKSPGRSRDTGEKYRPWVVFINFSSLFFLHIVGRLFYQFITAHSPFRPINDLKTHLKRQKPTLTTKRCQSFQLHFSRNLPSITYLTLRGHNVTVALYAQFGNWCQIKASRIALSVGISNSDWPKLCTVHET